MFCTPAPAQAVDNTIHSLMQHRPAPCMPPWRLAAGFLSPPRCHRYVGRNRHLAKRAGLSV